MIEVDVIGRRLVDQRHAQQHFDVTFWRQHSIACAPHTAMMCRWSHSAVWCLLAGCCKEVHAWSCSAGSNYGAPMWQAAATLSLRQVRYTKLGMQYVQESSKSLAGFQSNGPNQPTEPRNAALVTPLQKAPSIAANKTHSTYLRSTHHECAISYQIGV